MVSDKTEMQTRRRRNPKLYQYQYCEIWIATNVDGWISCKNVSITLFDIGNRNKINKRQASVGNNYEQILI